MRHRIFACCFCGLLASVSTALAGGGNRLAYLDEFCDPYYVGLATARLVTPQWIGEEGVEAVVVLSVDDMTDPAQYEKFLRPILDRLKRIDGRALLSIMTKRVDPKHPQLAAWQREGVTVEAHTYDHPCPCLGKGDFAKAKTTYDRCIDELANVPDGPPRAFRMPCCDSMNSAGPRFFSEIFNRTTPQGRFLEVDSSVTQVFTADDPQLPRSLATQDDGRPRFSKYMPTDRKFVNYVCNYPYPYVISRLCWELPLTLPDDWQGFHLQGANSSATVNDMKAGIDATVLKQGLYVLTFHPHNWIQNGQIVELIDHAVTRHGRKVKFLNFREAYDRLTKHLLGGQPLRRADGQDNGVRVMDVNGDGYMDVVIGNATVRQTRIWSPAARQWTTTAFPVDVTRTAAKFGILQPGGGVSVLARDEQTTGLWHCQDGRWQADPQGLAGLELSGPVATSAAGRDQGVRLLDLAGDGRCELIVANPRQNGVFRWQNETHSWCKLPFDLPGGATIVDAQGHDAGCRLVDIDGDGHPDVVFSNAQRCSLHLFTSIADGWSRKILSAAHGEASAIYPIIRADGSNNGVWFKDRHVWIQNEDTGEDAVFDGRPTRIPTEGRSYATLLDRGAL